MTAIVLVAARFVYISMLSYIRESFTTADVHALMGFLPGVGANVDGESTPLNETLTTPWSHTRVWSLVGMNSVVSLQVRLPVEALDWLIS